MKQFLKDIKTAACLAQVLVEAAEPDPLSPTEQALLCIHLFVVDGKGQTLVDTTLNPNLTPPDAGSTYESVDESGFSLRDYGDALKEEACKALEKYCEGNGDVAAGQYTRRSIHVLPGFREAAGL